jgi:hypothetical protein
MPDFGAPVADKINVDPDEGLKTLSQIMSIRQQQQVLQTGQSTQLSAQAKATVDQQGAKEMQGLVQLVSDPVANGITYADGTEQPGAKNKILSVAPTTGAENYEKLVNASRVKVEFNNSVNNLRSTERNEVGNTVAGAAANAQTPSEVIDAINNLVESKKGTPVYDDYKTIGDTATHVINHTDKTQRQTGRIIPTGQEAWRNAALSVGRQVLGAAGVVGAGGIANPVSASNAAGQGQLINPITGARSLPELMGDATNPVSPQVAAQTVHATGGANIDVQRASDVSNLQKQSAALIPLTHEIDRLAHEISSSKIAGAVTGGLKNLGFASIAEARTQLEKDLGLVKGPLAASAGSDSRASAILEGYPTVDTPEKTTNAAMDYVRGSFRQNLARGQLLKKHGVDGFAAADDELTRASDPLAHEAAALPPGKPGGFYKRNFGTAEEAQKFKDRVDAIKKHTRFLGDENGPAK